MEASSSEVNSSKEYKSIQGADTVKLEAFQGGILGISNGTRKGRT
jgi:hypothetical protein